MKRMTGIHILMAAAIPFLLAGCGPNPYPGNGIKPTVTFPVTTNHTPYSRCLSALKSIPGNNLPVFAVGEVADKTGQINYDENGHALSQGVSEMLMSALFKTGKTRLSERFDLRIPLAELKMVQQKLTDEDVTAYKVKTSDFVVLGALTELNYNIVSDGLGVWVSGIGGGGRTVVINVALDLRVIDSKSFRVAYVTSLQKQIYGFEVEANVFRFFGTQLVEFDAGRIQNEPLQLGVRSVVEMAVYQIMTDFLGLPKVGKCELVDPEFFPKNTNEENEK